MSSQKDRRSRDDSARPAGSVEQAEDGVSKSGSLPGGPAEGDGDAQADSGAAAAGESELRTSIRYTSPMLWLALLALFAGAYYCRSRTGPAAGMDTILAPEVMAAFEVAVSMGVDRGCQAAVESLDDERLVAIVTNGEEPFKTRAAAALAIGSRRCSAAAGVLRNLVLDEDELVPVRATAALSLGLVGTPAPELAGMVNRVQRREVRKALVAASRLTLRSEDGSPPAGLDGVLAEFRLRDYWKKIDGLVLEARKVSQEARKRRRRLRERHLYMFAPFIMAIGTLGMSSPPLLLLVLPFAVYPFGLKTGAFFALSFFTLAGLEQEWFVNLAIVSAVTLVGLEYIENTSTAYCIQFLCVLCIVNLRGPIMMLVYRKKSASELLREVAAGGKSRKMALDALSDKGAELLPELLELFDQESPVNRALVCEALGRIQDPRAHDRLVRALDDDDTRVKAAAVLALGEFRDPRLLKRLTIMTRDGNDLVRLNAVRAIGRYGTRPARIILETMLDHEDDGIRIAAREALSRTK